MFTPTLFLAHVLINARIEDAERKRLAYAVSRKKKDHKATRSTPVFLWMGRKLNQIGRRLQPNTSIPATQNPASCASCLENA